MWSSIVTMANEWFEETKAYPPHVWLDDPRDPLFTFMWDDQEFGFYAMSFTYWAEVLTVSAAQVFLCVGFPAERVLEHSSVLSMFVANYFIFVLNFCTNAPSQVMTFQGLMAACFSQLVFNFVIPNKKTTTAYMIGYGFIIPFWLWFPSTVINYLDVRNKVFRFCIAAVTPSLCVFRTTEGEIVFCFAFLFFAFVLNTQ